MTLIYPNSDPMGLSKARKLKRLIWKNTDLSDLPPRFLKAEVNNQLIVISVVERARKFKTHNRIGPKIGNSLF